ncbi:aspartate/glutamate racemase family protein [Ureibacillus thermophilus]|uniref:aspartate/glutamate racemase family protein n=1 Tax=Ureibacillus thermophilus TaxID=367743 RepID=UPI00361CF118
MKKTLGIIGGVGPLATMFLGEAIVRLTNAKTDQEHLHTIIDNDTRIPDRSAFILGKSNQNPVPVIIEDARKLASYGADLVCIPCNTAHSFYEEIQQGSPIPVIHMIRETAKRAKSLEAKKAAILATDGTIYSKVYQKALMEEGIEPVIPDEHTQKLVMSIIYDHVKSGKEVTREKWSDIEAAVFALDCDRIILGCTELSVVNKNLQLGERYIDSLLVLAETAIIRCGYEVKK